VQTCASDSPLQPSIFRLYAAQDHRGSIPRNGEYSEETCRGNGCRTKPQQRPEVGLLSAPRVRVHRSCHLARWRRSAGEMVRGYPRLRSKHPKGHTSTCCWKRRRSRNLHHAMRGLTQKMQHKCDNTNTVQMQIASNEENL